MSRVTRSQKIDIAEDESATISTNATSNFPSMPLAELLSSNVMEPTPDAIATEVKGLKAAYRTAIGGDRKTPKRGRKPNQEHMLQSQDAATRSENIPPAFSAAIKGNVPANDALIPSGQTLRPSPEPAKRTTRRQAAQAKAERERCILGEREQSNLPMRAIESAGTIAAITSTPTAATNLPVRPSAAEPEHLLFNATTDEQIPDAESMAKTPLRCLEDVAEAATPSQADHTIIDEDDSFVKHIIARSPSKPVSRIEDSVEALDQLEDALEALDAATLAEQVESPQKTRWKEAFHMPLDWLELHRLRSASKNRNPGQLFKGRTPEVRHSSANMSSVITRTPTLKKASSMCFQTMTAKTGQDQPFASRLRPATVMSERAVSVAEKGNKSTVDSHTKTTKKPIVRRPLSLLPPKETVKSSKPVTVSTFELPGEAVARRLKEQREARNARREAGEQSVQPKRAASGPRVKSTKPPTVSNFELPGEALSRKKREATEAKIMAQEEEERRRRQFKAKPARHSIVPDIVPRETITSRARHSKIGLEDMKPSAPMKRPSSTNNIGGHRPSLATFPTANTSSTRARGPTNSTQRQSSVSGLGTRTAQRAVSASDAQIQRERGKVIYNRDAKQTEEIERERREREAAAKKAREEAAERGRQASREWAEKMMAKRVAMAASAKNAS